MSVPRHLPGLGRLRALMMKRSPAFRLMLAYVGVLMVFSVAFSFIVYGLADNQLLMGLGRQLARYEREQGFAPGGPPQPIDASNIPAALQATVDASRQSLVLELAYLNLVVLVVGCIASYWLARRTLRPIEQALDAQKRFTADASHELRTPLAVMRTEIEIARAPGSKLSKDEAVSLIDSNLEEVVRLQALSDALLRLARSNEKPLVMKPVATPVVVTAAIERAQGAARQRGISLVNDASDAVVMADQASLTELVAILLDNAVKYSVTGTSAVVRSYAQGHYGFISVSDQGRGIAADDLPRVFDRFYRADKSRTTQDVEGHGLGLSIASHIATANRGEIDVQSEVGKGTTFTIRLRLA